MVQRNSICPNQKLLDLYGSKDQVWDTNQIGISAKINFLSKEWVIQERDFALLLYWLGLHSWISRNKSSFLTGANFNLYLLDNDNNQLFDKQEIYKKYQYLFNNPSAWPVFCAHQRNNNKLFIVTPRLDNINDQYSYIAPIDSQHLWDEHTRFWPEALKTWQDLSLIEEPLPVSCLLRSHTPGQYAHGADYREIISILVARGVDRVWLEKLPLAPVARIAPVHGDLILKNMVLDRQNFRPAKPRLIDWESVSYQSIAADLGHYLAWGLNFSNSNNYLERFFFAEEEAAQALEIGLEEWRRQLLWSVLREACFWSAENEDHKTGRVSFPQIINCLKELF